MKHPKKIRARRITGRWRKIKGHRFAWRDFPAIGGSYRMTIHHDQPVWDISSVFDNKGWDEDRTHFLTLPNPPLAITARSTGAGREGK